MLVVMALPACLLFICLFAVPESPRWLVAKNRNNEALRILTRTAGEQEAGKELADIEETLKEHKEASYREILSPSIRPLLLMGIMLSVFQQITGINTIMYYAPKIFAGVGQSTDSALIQTVAIGATNLVFTIIAMILIDRIGRKMLVLIGSAGMMGMLGGLSALYFLNLTSGIFILALILGYIAFFAASLGPAIWVIVAEIFPNRLRSKGMSIAIVALWLACAIVSIAFPQMLEKLNGGTTFLVFAIICLANFIYVLKNVPETKGKSLENLEKELERN